MTEIPHSIEAEQAVLGAVLIAPERMAILGPRLCGADFYRTAHLTIWIAMTDLWTATESVTLIGLKGRTVQAGQAGGCGWASLSRPAHRRGAAIDGRRELRRCDPGSCGSAASPGRLPSGCGAGGA